MKDNFKISQSLRDLNTETIITLGEALGLRRPKLKKMKDMPGDMVAAWLRGEDECLTYGSPTWSLLAEKLDIIGQRGIANRIREKQGLPIQTFVTPEAPSSGMLKNSITFRLRLID